MTEAPMNERNVAQIIDLTDVSMRLDAARMRLESIAQDLRGLWTDALRTGDFSTVDRVVEASHAVHRASVALGENMVQG